MSAKQSKQPKRYLVTGATGFIGSALVRALVERGERVRAMDDDSRGSKGRLADVADRVEWAPGDVRKLDSVLEAAKGVDVVLHLAAVNGTEFFYTRPELVLDVAVRGMLNVVDACRAHGIRELVVASSSEVYQTPPMVPTSEEVPLCVPDPLNPRYSYGGGKIATELMALNYGRSGFDRVMVFRPHNVFGPQMGWEHVVPQMALRLKALTEGPAASSGTVDFPIQGSGEETRSFLFIEDMIRGLLTVIDRGEHLGIYHLGTEREVSIRELAEKVAACVGRKIRVVPGPLKAGGTLRRCPSIAKARALGFEPVVSLEEGLARTVSWYWENAAECPPEKYCL
jgi:nucleoside-diphosphate-sugar epimerase